MRRTIPAKSPVQYPLRPRPVQIQIVLHSSLGSDVKPGQLQTATLRAIARLGILLLLAVPLGFSADLAAQTHAPAPATLSAHPVHKPNHVHAKPSAAHAVEPPPTPAPPTPPQPEIPKWPVNEKADPASVVWDSNGLRIDATNSSLEQILSDVSADTGAKVEGLDNDQRIFGTFGPGSARDVLGQLLDGSGYNFLLIGDQGQGTPREIVLSVRSAGSTIQGAKPSAPNDEEEVDEQPQQAEPQEGIPPQRPGFPPRALQQRMQRQGQQPGEPPNQQPGQPPN